MRRQFLSIVGEGLFESGVEVRGTTAGRHPAGIGTRDVLAPAVAGGICSERKQQS